EHEDEVKRPNGPLFGQNQVWITRTDTRDRRRVVIRVPAGDRANLREIRANPVGKPRIARPAVEHVDVMPTGQRTAQDVRKERAPTLFPWVARTIKRHVLEEIHRGLGTLA